MLHIRKDLEHHELDLLAVSESKTEMRCSNPSECRASDRPKHGSIGRDSNGSAEHSSPLNRYIAKH